MTIRPAIADDAPRITDIYNQGIAERGATFETEPNTVDSIRARIEESERFPWLVADDGAT
jgi:phosphinothricin acetyltransferase